MTNVYRYPFLGIMGSDQETLQLWGAVLHPSGTHLPSARLNPNLFGVSSPEEKNTVIDLGKVPWPFCVWDPCLGSEVTTTFNLTRITTQRLEARCLSKATFLVDTTHMRGLLCFNTPRISVPLQPPVPSKSPVWVYQINECRILICDKLGKYCICPA